MAVSVGFSPCTIKQLNAKIEDMERELEKQNNDAKSYIALGFSPFEAVI